MQNNRQDALVAISAPSLSKLEGIKHGFFTREGGVSSGVYASLNAGFSSADHSQNIRINRQIVAEHLGVSSEKFYSADQHHSSDVIVVDEGGCKEKCRGDALVTRAANCALAVLTADCGPVLFADVENHVIGAAHAGWRGALNGILENTIGAMVKLGAEPKTIKAVLGPTIGPQKYEVSASFRQTFVDRNPSYNRYFLAIENPDHYLFNLWAFIIDRLEDAGVTATCLAMCTYGDPKRFYSYRRSTHEQEVDYGRQISAIALDH